MTDTNHNIHENTDKTPNELLDWLCWVWATDGEQFYPPDETATECFESLETTNSDALAYEEGYHARAYTQAVDRYHNLQKKGFNPKARAERHIHEAQENGLDLDDIDWAWLENSSFFTDENSVDDEFTDNITDVIKEQKHVLDNLADEK